MDVANVFIQKGLSLHSEHDFGFASTILYFFSFFEFIGIGRYWLFRILG